jgi:HK97 family phage portal protein
MAVSIASLRSSVRTFWYKQTPFTEEKNTIALYTTQTFEQNRKVIDLEEAATKGVGKKVKSKSGPQNLSTAWDDASNGVPGTTLQDGLLSERDKKDTYYKAYIGNPWVRACVQAIAKRFTSGKWEIEPTQQGKGDLTNKEKINSLLLYVNEEEDFKQLLRSIAEDLGIYGESFLEIVCDGQGNPTELYKVDCQTMSVEYDRHGRVVKYSQELDKNNDIVEFEPGQIIRWWLPDPRANKKALSPIECMKDSVFLYQSMITWGEKFFKQGAQPGFSIEMGPDAQLDDAQRYITFFRENYMGIQNAHVPPVTYGGSKLQVFNKGSVEIDFLKSLSWARDEILAGYNVPLSVTGIQEVAHLGGGSGESSNKLFIYNVVKPIEEIILEKFNYRILQKKLKIYDWIVTVQHADYRDDESISKIHDMQVRNGTMTVNESRQEKGRMPVVGGNEAVIVASREIVPVIRLAEMADEQRQTAAIDLQTKEAQVQSIKITTAATASSVLQPQETAAQENEHVKYLLKDILLPMEDV